MDWSGRFDRRNSTWPIAVDAKKGAIDVPNRKCDESIHMSRGDTGREEMMEEEG